MHSSDLFSPMTGGFIRSIIAKTGNPNLENSSNGYYPNIVSKINIDHDFDKKTNSRTLTFSQKNRFLFRHIIRGGTYYLIA